MAEKTCDLTKISDPDFISTLENINVITTISSNLPESISKMCHNLVEKSKFIDLEKKKDITNESGTEPNTDKYHSVPQVYLTDTASDNEDGKPFCLVENLECDSSNTSVSMISSQLSEKSQKHYVEPETKEIPVNCDVYDEPNQHSLPTSILSYMECASTNDLKLERALECYIKNLEEKQTSLKNEVGCLKKQLKTQEYSFKNSELQMREDYLQKIEKLSKECNTLHKEKESIVIRYANSEKDVIMEKKAQQELEKKVKDLAKEKDNLISKNKCLCSEINKLTTSYESKMVEFAKLQKNLDRLNSDFNSREIRIKWIQNKLKTETSAHQETQSKLDLTKHRLNEMKEEAEQVRKDFQEMIKCYQEAEEIKSIKLDNNLKKKLPDIEVQQEKSDKEQTYYLLRQELDALKNKQRVTIEENNSLALKIHGLEKNRLEYEQNISKLKDSQNMLKQENVDLAAHLAEMETLQLQLEREKDKSAATLREVDRLRLTNAELQSDMNACHIKEGELLKFTEGVTDTNVKLQSAHSLLEIKAQSLEDNLSQSKKYLTDIQQKYLQLVKEFETSKKEHEDEVQILAKKLAEKTKNMEKLNTKIDEAENENRVLKRRHLASIKELSRELCECKRKLDNVDYNCSTKKESAIDSSLSSSTLSLDVMNSNETINGVSSPATSVSFYSKSVVNPSQNVPSEIPGIDKEMLIERIITLQKILVQKNDKIDFLEDHVVQLVKEMKKIKTYKC